MLPGWLSTRFFGEERRRGVLGQHVAAVQARSYCEERRQATRALGVEDAVGAALGDRSELGHGSGHEVECEAQGLSMEVAA